VAITINGTPAPRVFLNPNGGGEAINLDSSINSPSNPAPDGGLMAISAIGNRYFPWSDGRWPSPRTCSARLSVCCAAFWARAAFPSVSRMAVTVTYSGAAPDHVNGVVQFGCYLSMNGFDSNSFIIDAAPSKN
jgi:hypothetical protein